MRKFAKGLTLILALFLVTVPAYAWPWTKKPPVSLAFTHELGDSSGCRTVLIINRSSSETVVIRLSVENKKAHQRASTVVKIAPGKTRSMESFAHDAGFWVFEKGEVVTLKADGYSGSVSRTIK